MAIAARTNPSVLVNGVVLRERTISKKDTGEVLGASYLIDTAGGPLYVTAWARSGAELGVADTVSIWATVDEGERGSQLTFDRHVTPDDLDKISNTMKVLTGK